jgi:cell division protease FtsH
MRLLHIFLPQTDPVEKISIVRRGHALWVTWMIPEEDKNLYSKAKFLDQVVSLLWWRAAEEIFFWEDEITTGASNDFEKATFIVRDMITKYGMDKILNNLSMEIRNQKNIDLLNHIVKKYLSVLITKFKNISLPAIKNPRILFKKINLL